MTSLFHLSCCAAFQSMLKDDEFFKEISNSPNPSVTDEDSNAWVLPTPWDLVLLPLKLCQPSPLAQTCCNKIHKKVPQPFLRAIFNYEPKVLQCPVQCDSVEKAHSPIFLLSFVVSITAVRGVRKHLGQPHCLPASWFLEIFCMWLCQVLSSR